MTEHGAIPIHGTMSPTGVPTALERGGRLQRVVSQEYRMDLQIAACERGDWHGYWDVELADATRLTVYRDLTRGGWYELVNADDSVDSVDSVDSHVRPR